MEYANTQASWKSVKKRDLFTNESQQHWNYLELHWYMPLATVQTIMQFTDILIINFIIGPIPIILYITVFQKFCTLNRIYFLGINPKINSQISKCLC